MCLHLFNIKLVVFFKLYKNITVAKLGVLKLPYELNLLSVLFEQYLCFLPIQHDYVIFFASSHYLVFLMQELCVLILCV